jgi:hypothetical protein
VFKSFPFGELLPDQAPSGQLIAADGCYATPNGYAPVGSFNPFTPALSGFLGGAAFVSSDGTAALIAGTPTNLYRYSGSAWSSLLGSLTASVWRFGQFGDNIISVNGGDPVSFDIAGGTAALLAGSPPPSDMVTIVRDFVLLAGDPDNILRVTWSGFNDSTEWTPGTNQSDYQDMLSGGEVTGLAGGEYGIILQRQAIKRMTYVGGEVIFQFDEIESNIGCMAKGSVAQAGRLVFFLSERGFMLCDGNSATPIGAEKIDRTFFGSYSREDIVNSLTAAIDPRRYIVAWSMPGRMWLYNWQLQRWTTVTLDVRYAFSGFTANIDLDSLDAIYGNLDAIPVSLDDPIFQGGNPLFLIVDSTGLVGTLTGDHVEASFTMATLDFGDRVRMRSGKFDSDTTSAQMTLDGRTRAGDGENERDAGSMRSNGELPIRFNARYFKPTIAIPAGEAWTYAKGLGFYFEGGGRK